MAQIHATLNFYDFENLSSGSDARPIPTKYSWGGTSPLINQAWPDLAWPEEGKGYSWLAGIQVT